MPVYVYGCENGHSKEVVHSMKEADTVVVTCGQCGGSMHRIPQNFSWYHPPYTILLDKLAARREAKGRKKRRK